MAVGDASERLENLCRKDLDAADRHVHAITTAMDDVEKALPGAWVGKKADNWRTDYEGRMRRLKRLFAQLPAERKHLIETAKTHQHKLDGASHGGHL